MSRYSHSRHRFFSFAACSGVVLALAASTAPDGPGPTEPPDEVTYAEDVAPILLEECVQCHRPAGNAPFSLLTYEDARARAGRIARMTETRRMPPWFAEPEGEFVGERRLTEDEISLLRRWADAGAPLGDSTAAPPLPPPPSGWQLGEPDLVVDFPAYSVPPEGPDGEDLYRNLVAGVPVDETRYVEAVEVMPMDVEVVHHTVLKIDTTSSSRQLDARDETPGFDRLQESGRARIPEGQVPGWMPGRTPLPPVEGIAWPLGPGTDLVLETHLQPTGREERIEPKVGLYFAEGPPEKRPVRLLLESRTIDIPPGVSDYRVTNSYQLPVDVQLLSIFLHAHFLGKDLRASATLPTGRIRRLVRIPDWDFNWQQEYRYREPVRLPAGTIVTMDFTFDNSAANPQNPHDPPRRVVGGPGSTDEMAQLALQLLPRNRIDRETLVEDLMAWEHRQATEAAMFREIEAGNRSLEAGEPDRAIDHFRGALQNRLDHPEALTGMTRAFLMKGDFESARLAGERAAQVTDRRDPAILHALAEAYAGLGEEEALPTVREAVEVARRQGRSALADSLEAKLADLQRAQP